MRARAGRRSAGRAEPRREGGLGSVRALGLLAGLTMAATLPVPSEAESGPRPASVVVAPADAPEAVRATADIVAEGRNDERALLASLLRAPRHPVLVDTSPAGQAEVEAYGRFSVLWLPGTYNLDEPLLIPDSADLLILAEGAVLNYRAATGDAVTVGGTYRSRYRFGTIQSGSSGAALRIAPGPTMPALMSEITFTGLVGMAGTDGGEVRGTGLLIDPSQQNVTTNRIAGTDVGGFETCLSVRPPAEADAVRPGFGKMDTNHFWLSYLRRCRTAIRVDGARGVDSNVWDVNVDASLPGSIAIRTSGAYDRWRVIMGTWGEGSTALILDPGAHHNTIEMTPPLDRFAFRNDSGNRTNVIVGAAGIQPVPTRGSHPPLSVVLLEQGAGPGGAYNLLRLDDRFVAVRQDLGAVDFTDERLGDRDLPPHLYRAEDREAVLGRIAADGGDPTDYLIRPAGDRVVAVARRLGDVAVGAERIGERTLAPQIVAGQSEAAVRALLETLADRQGR